MSYDIFSKQRTLKSYPRCLYVEIPRSVNHSIQSHQLHILPAFNVPQSVFTPRDVRYRAIGTVRAFVATAHGLPCYKEPIVSPDDVVRSLVRLLLTTNVFTPTSHDPYVFSFLFSLSTHEKILGHHLSEPYSSRLRIMVPSPPSWVLYKKTKACRFSGLRHNRSQCIHIHSQFTRAYQNHIKYNLSNTVATCG